MKEHELESIKVQLNELKADLLAREGTSHEATKTVVLDQAAVGRVSRIDAIQQQEMALEAERRRLLMLKKIEGAFMRLETSEFGECFVCGVDIGLNRLSLNPLLTRCLNCAE
jgi:DnaK suppressor protein